MTQFVYSPPSSLIELKNVGGLFLPEPNLWLDAQRSKPWAFISHAHSDHVARHKQILCSTATGYLLEKRYSLKPERLHRLDFGEILEREGFRYQLSPAGHIHGSAMLHLTRLHDGSSLLYTGDFKLRPSPGLPEVHLPMADLLVMESTFGLPHYIFPPDSEIDDQIHAFVHASHQTVSTPVFLAYALGKSQEIAAILHRQNIPFAMTKDSAAMHQACIESGMDLPNPFVWKGGSLPKDHCLISTPQTVRMGKIAGIESPATAILSGWAMDPSAKYRYRTAAAIPLSDHADFPDLLLTVHTVKPKQIITVHGFTRQLAATLRTYGFESWSIDGNDQLELGL